MHRLNLTAFAACAALALLAPAAPAAAAGISVVASDCVSVSHVDGCLFSGNIAPNKISDTEDAYNLFNNTHPSAGPDIDLNFLFKSDDGAGFLGTVTGSTTSGTWSTPGFLIDFVAVKSSAKFVLYKLATPASTGSWDTFDIPYSNNPKDLSHLSFFGSAAPGVPEPATWAMMLAGFGGMGALLRRARRQARTAVA